MPVSRSTSTSAKPATIGMRLAVARHGVAGHGEQSLAGQRLRRSHREFVDALGQFVAVVDAAQFDGALGGLRQGHARAAALAEDALAAHFVIFGLAAEILGRDLLQLVLGIHARRRTPRASWREWSGCRPRDRSTAGSRPVLPQVISHFSHGTPRISAVTRWQSLTDSVPRLPMPDWM